MIELPEVDSLELIELPEGIQEGTADAVGETAIRVEGVGEFEVIGGADLELPGADEFERFRKKRGVAEVPVDVG